MANRQNSLGPSDLIREDGSRNWQVLKALARRRAIFEVAKVKDHVAHGRLPADYSTTMVREFRHAVRHYRGIADVAWSVHPANRGQVPMVTISPFGRQREGVRMSRF